ncbi:mechanosensitive ion channel family protein [Gammaproteobacteria bacterium]|jgi:MscS family membrane protein|nr:mechanosensitive ion channel family protein [Gammaproteobacteria bacterium]MDA8865766.1 mechanosensitive ion channel family protein [Gammaproteobacteria bacterium]MDA8999380.1 mechanosensitive ion channel family protein [Gammaproteobacteria bacterium]MDA9247940.1 mechanosensitive ion channel family protein [Gammaproteobacteria bacterium]MDB4156668.1 mechanosensitive ion channel family protein [Gammaproteobacteria bacterium]|tara:strand:+ start:16213 stop:17298 length:1086 start_codon:yes stop_codon:yes gene_type:complete
MDNFLELVSQVWNRGFLGIDLGSIISSLAVILIAFLFRGFVISVILNALGRLADKTESKIDDEILSALRKPIGLIPVTIAFYLCTLILPIEGLVGDIATNIVKAFVIFTIFSALSNAVKPIFVALSTSAWLTASMQMWLERASRFLVWVIGIAIILDIFGIQIGPLVAGLGLFSVAVALGAQDFFKNLIAGILIIGEHRFQPGDRIEVSGQLHGIVETIGFRSTVIRTFDTAPMTIPNKDLSDVKVINHGDMFNRRLNWKINLIYSTSVEQLELIRTEIKEYIINSDDFVSDPDLDPVVRVVELGASSIDILIVAYSDPVGFAAYNEVKENLIFNIMKIVKANNSEFAYPSTSLYVESMPK